MVIVLTICSANYLAHAKTLGDSVLEHNPDFHFVIGLVDRIPKILDPSYCQPFEVIPVEGLNLPQFVDMRQKYNIVELNTAVKPFYMSFLFKRDPSVEAVIYLDPDILVYGSFGALLKKLQNNSIVVTPHSCTYDNSGENIHYEKVMLWAGVFNLGFIATSRSAEAQAFLEWWEIRLQGHCFRKASIPGSFYDQIWVGLASLYYPGLYVEKDPGYNLCYWNHFERRLEVRDGRYVVNGQHNLIFVHFSGYKPEKPEAVVSRLTEPIASFDERPDLRSIYYDYRSRLLARNYPYFRPLPWYFDRPKEAAGKRRVKQLLKAFVKRVVGAIPCGARLRLKRFAQFVVRNS